MKEINKIVINSETFYFFALFLFLIRSWLFFSNLLDLTEILDQSLKLAILLLFIIRIITDKIYKKKLLFTIFLVLIMIIISNNNDFINLFYTFLTILCSKNIDTKKIVKFIFIFNLVMIIIHFAYFFYNYFTNKSSLDYILNRKMQKRYYCYIRHPNYVAAILFWTLCEFIYISKGRKWFNIILSISIMLFVYFVTRSRTTLLIYILLIIYLFFKEKYSKKFLINCFYFTIIGGIIMTIISINVFNSPGSILHDSVIKLDELLSHRITYSSKAMELFPITFFGNKIDVEAAWYGNRLMIDSFYVSCFVEYGICLLVITIAMAFKVIKKMNTEELFLLILVFITALTERYLFYVVLCFPLLFFRQALERDRSDWGDTR